MSCQIRLRDPRIEPLDPAPRASDAYLHRAARMAVLLALPTLAAASDWPRFRGPRGARVAIERALPATHGLSRSLAWRRETPIGETAPLFAEGRVFVAGMVGAQAVVQCLDARTGDEVWTRLVGQPTGMAAQTDAEQSPPLDESASGGLTLRIDRPPGGAPCVVASEAGQSAAYALETGEVLWERETEPAGAEGSVGRIASVSGDSPDAAPTAYGERLYVRTANALYCFGADA